MRGSRHVVLQALSASTMAGSPATVRAHNTPRPAPGARCFVRAGPTQLSVILFIFHLRSRSHPRLPRASSARRRAANSASITPSTACSCLEGLCLEGRD
ncbi:hypothetical protein BJV78DRAFT_1203545, partial [Lactifluus subvellereus]